MRSVPSASGLLVANNTVGLLTMGGAPTSAIPAVMILQSDGVAIKAELPGGKELFEANCGVCHESATEERKMGPGLKDLSKRAKLVNGEATSDASITALVNAGGNGMPGFGDLLTTAEKADILAFLKSL